MTSCRGHDSCGDRQYQFETGRPVVIPRRYTAPCLPLGERSRSSVNQENWLPPHTGKRGHKGHNVAHRISDSSAPGFIPSQWSCCGSSAVSRIASLDAPGYRVRRKSPAMVPTVKAVRFVSEYGPQYYLYTKSKSKSKIIYLTTG